MSAVRDDMRISANLFVARPLASGDGYTWTLASRLGEMLGMAESLFGERDRSYTILGLEFHDGNPQVWYPGDCHHVIIQLALRCMLEPAEALYEMAHECIHLLAPHKQPGTNVLEEGLATHFAERYLRERIRESRTCALPNYLAAQKRVERLLNIDPWIVRTLRQTQPAIRIATAGDITACNPCVPHDLAEQVTKPFPYGQVSDSVRA